MGRIIASGTVTPGANAESAELISSDKIRAPESGKLILIAQSAQADSTVKLLVGGDSICDNAVIHKWITPHVLDYPADLMVQTDVKSGDALSLKVRNVTSAVVDYRLMIL